MTHTPPRWRASLRELLSVLGTSVIAVTAVFGAATPGRAKLREGPWRAWIETPAGELPFDLEIRTEGNRTRAWISNGDERVPVPETRVGQTVVFDIPHYDSRLEASPSPEGTRLDGFWRRGFGEIDYEMPFHATAGPAARFVPDEASEDPEDKLRLPERWVVELEGETVPAVGLLHETDDGLVRGTFLHISGDLPSLVGVFRDGRLRLSRFDGGGALLFDARLQPDGTLEGKCWGMSHFVKRWTARPDPDAHLRDPFAYLRVAPDPDLDSLVAYDLEGTPSTLSAARPAGAVVILEILGTWCPNCHDASSFLMQLRRDYGDRGLEVLGLAFEIHGDFDRNVAALQRYRKRHGIEYPLLLASTGPRVSPSAFFPPLEGEYAFPTIFFLDRHGRIRGTYTGFRGPSSGDEHEIMKARWRALIERLLAEG